MVDVRWSRVNGWDSILHLDCVVDIEQTAYDSAKIGYRGGIRIAESSMVAIGRVRGKALRAAPFDLVQRSGIDRCEDSA